MYAEHTQNAAKKIEKNLYGGYCSLYVYAGWGGGNVSVYALEHDYSQQDTSLSGQISALLN